MSNTVSENQFRELPTSGGGDPPDPEKAKLATRGSIAALLYAVGLLILSLSACGDGEKKQKDELETLRKALNAQLSAYVLCVTEGNETTFPSNLVSNVGNGDDKYFPDPIDEENVDWANIPTAAKRYAWKNYTLELNGDGYGTVGPHHNVYSWSNGVKTKVGQLNVKDIDTFFPEDNLFVGDGKIWHLAEQDGTVIDTEIGPLPIGSEICMKDGRLLTTYQSTDGKGHLTAVAIDPSNPSNPIQPLKDVIYNPTDLGGWSAGMDYSNGTLVLVAGNGCKIYRKVPEGIDFMDHLDDYFDKTVNPSDATYQMATLNGYVFLRLGETKIHIIPPTGPEQTIHKDDFGGGLFEDMVKTSIGISIVQKTGQLLTAEIMGDGGINVYPDPGDHTGEAEECSPLSQEQAEEMFNMGLPDPTEPDPEFFTEPDEDIFVPLDQYTKDGSGADAGDTFDADVPPLDSADGFDATDPDITDPDADAKPGDTKPEDLPQPEVKPDAEDANPDPDAKPDVKPDPDIQPDKTDPDPKPDNETPDEDASIPPEQATEQTSEPDQTPGGDIPVSPEDSIQPASPGCSCATTEPRKPQGLGGKAAVVLMAISAFLGLKVVGKRRRKEEEIQR